jgi:hypothetical protein
VLRRSRALAALDVEVGESVRARDERRREHLRKILARLYVEKGRKRTKRLPLVVDVLHMLTSFETFDALLTGDPSVDDVTRLLGQLAAAVVDVPLTKRRVDR